MTEFSPDAQSVFNAAFPVYDEEVLYSEPSWKHVGMISAATLRAATELDTIKPQAVGPCDEFYGSSTKLITTSEQELKYQIALAVKQAKVETYRALRSIASELEGTKNA